MNIYNSYPIDDKSTKGYSCALRWVFVNGSRILIADDHEVLRRGVRAWLETQDNYEVVGEASNGREAVEKTKELRPDVVILDVWMPVLNGFEAAQMIREMSPKTPILFFTIDHRKEYLDEARRIGMCSFVAKGEDGPVLLQAVDAALQNRTFFSE
jgi:two-component system, NarL family, nitrate/nitrite response regulator NarL